MLKNNSHATRISILEELNSNNRTFSLPEPLKYVMHAIKKNNKSAKVCHGSRTMKITEQRSVMWRINKCPPIDKEAKGTSDGWKNLYRATDAWEKETSWWTVSSFPEPICQNLREGGRRWGWKGEQQPNHKGTLCPSKVFRVYRDWSVVNREGPKGPTKEPAQKRGKEQNVSRFQVGNTKDLQCGAQGMD